MPPPGYPPGGGYAMPAPGRTSGTAVTSLIFGILICIPFLTSLLATILGFVGISSTKNPAVRGRGMAIAGLILGILGLLMWGSVSLRLEHYLQATVSERVFAKTYVNNLLAGNLSANASSSTAQITQDELQTLQQQAQPFGTLQNSYIFAIPGNENGFYMCVAVGVCQFSNGQHQFQMKIVKDSNGNLLADSFQWSK
jgi:uncharacterized membrane protein required for colicin V production